MAHPSSAQKDCSRVTASWKVMEAASLSSVGGAAAPSATVPGGLGASSRDLQLDQHRSDALLLQRRAPLLYRLAEFPRDVPRGCRVPITGPCSRRIPRHTLCIADVINQQ